MPHIAITMFAGHDEEYKENLAMKVKDCVVETLNVDRRGVSVSVHDIDREQWTEHMKRFAPETIYAHHED